MVWQALFGSTARSVITGAFAGDLLGVDIPFLGGGGGGNGGGGGITAALAPLVFMVALVIGGAYVVGEWLQ